VREAAVSARRPYPWGVVLLPIGALIGAEPPTQPLPRQAAKRAGSRVAPSVDLEFFCL